MAFITMTELWTESKQNAIHYFKNHVDATRLKVGIIFKDL